MFSRFEKIKIMCIYKLCCIDAIIYNYCVKKNYTDLTCKIVVNYNPAHLSDKFNQNGNTCTLNGY